jgi:DNA-binding beta-propeller fold protein YncE
MTILAPAWSSGGLLTQDPCPGSVTGPVVWKRLGNDVLENLLFADGSLWVSDSTAGKVVRIRPNRSVNEKGSLHDIGPGGLAAGPDGLIYVGNGNSIVNAILRLPQSSVIRFGPSDPDGTRETYADGFTMANGMTFGPGDDLFISNDFDQGLIRIPRAAPSSWSQLADVWGTNGLVVDPAGQNLYAAITFDQRSPIERIPLDDPSSHSTAAVLTFGVASLEPRVYPDPDPSKPLLGIKGLDDMTRDSDGFLYPVANGLGELLRVDPLTGDACLVASGLQNPSSVRIAPPGSAFDVSGEALTFFVVEFSGAIRVVGYTPAD